MSKKKGGKAKAGAEELVRLADEARRAFAAEMRRQEQEANKKATEEERKRREQEIKDVREAKRLAFQRLLDTDYLATRAKDTAVLEASVAHQEAWEKYLACIALPNVDWLPSLNAFLTCIESKEELVDEPREQLQSYLDACYMNEQVITLLSVLASKARENSDTAKLQWVNDYINRLRDNTEDKLDKITVSYLHLCDDFTDDDNPKEAVSHSCICPRLVPATAGLQVDDDEDRKSEGNNKQEKDMVLFPAPLEGFENPSMQFGIWVHFSNRERVKSVVFDKLSFKITKLPLALQQTRTCIRVLQTNYDHISSKKPVEDPRPDSKKKKRKKHKGQRYVSVGGIISVEQLAVPAPPRVTKGWLVREETPLTHAISVQPYPTKVEGAQQSSDPTPPLEIEYQIPSFVVLRDTGAPTFGWWNDKTQLWEEEGVEANGWDPETRTAEIKLSTLKPFAVIQPRALDFPYRSWSLTPTGINTAMICVTGSRFEVELEVVGGKCRLLKPNYPVLEPIHNKLLDPGTLLSRLKACGINLMPTDEDAIFCRKPLKNALEPSLHEQLAMVACLFEITGSNWNGARGSEKCMFKIKLAAQSALDDVIEAGADSDFREDEPPATPGDAEAEEEVAAPDDTKNDSDSDAGEEEEQDVVEPVFPEWLQIMCTSQSDITKFFVSQSTDKQFSEAVMEGQLTQATLRRTLTAYFNQRPVLDRTGIDVKQTFQRADRALAMMQQTVRKMLNLLRVFSFY